MKKVLMLIAEGFEEVEAVTPIDYLRRAGAEVVTAGIGGRTIRGSRGLSILCDTTVKETAGEWDAVIVPGGMSGAANIAADADCRQRLLRAAETGALIGAICAAPAVVLAPLGLLSKRRFTCYPGLEKEVVGGRWSADRVVADGNLITSRAAGTAGEWAAAMIGYLFGAAADKVAKSVLLAGFNAAGG